MTLSSLSLGGFAVASQVTPESKSASDFNVYRTIRTAEAVAKGSEALSSSDTRLLMAMAPDAAVYYYNEVLGSQVHSKLSAAEAAVSKPIDSVLPIDGAVDNGPAPLPHRKGIAAKNADHKRLAYASSRGRLFSSNRSLAWPMRGGLVTSRFGMRSGRMHQGTDIAAPLGTPILAAAGGKVVFSGWESGYGKLVIVDHGNGIRTKYGHCATLYVKTGQEVVQGDLLGKVGMTGHTSGPHLHYEVVHSGRPRNPESFTRRR